jgi:hypothetical protein
MAILKKGALVLIILPRLCLYTQGLAVHGVFVVFNTIIGTMSHESICLVVARVLATPCGLNLLVPNAFLISKQQL